MPAFDLVEKLIAVLPPVVFPVGIGVPQLHPELTKFDLRNPAQRIGEQFPAFRQTLNEIGMPILQSVEDGLKEIGGMGEVLDVLVDHRETVLGEIPQVIHHAGLAGATWGGEENMPGAEGLPEFGEEVLAEQQIGRVYRGAGVEFGAIGVGWHGLVTPVLHDETVIKQICFILYLKDKTVARQKCFIFFSLSMPISGVGHQRQ